MAVAFGILAVPYNSIWIGILLTVPRDALERTLKQVFGFGAFRPGQESVCRAVLDGRDALVVMPTGSGKSLCYQLPGVALGGTAVVISPLIALMEDQVAKLEANGLRADRIHSGRSRELSRAAAVAYRDGKLQFLFIAPERLAVPGFPEFLAKRKPSIVAVDEAHCISQWGHDFRPDYRMLRQYLPLVRPTPIMALTATATPVVQNDIVQQLGLREPLRSTQGFRRKNIAIEVIEIPAGLRRERVFEILNSEANRPAIVYVPTRGECDLLAADLARVLPSEPYHAGLGASRRQQVQDQFLAGKLDVIVATIAFGMGIDKPDIRTVIHTALPGSTEAYYQEIGRAGRDGAQSRAILMHSYADRRRHDFFQKRNYPEADVLAGVFQLLRTDRAIAKDDLQRAARLDADVFDTALDKLWVHGGAQIDPEENVVRGRAEWRESYLSQAEQKAGQLDLMMRYAEGDECRMAALVRYFGDRTDTQARCGLCDFCAPDKCVAQRFREASRAEAEAAAAVLETLSNGGPRSTGKLHSEFGQSSGLDRDRFEQVLGALARAGLIALRGAVFEKDGKQIPYRTAQITGEGSKAAGEGVLWLELREAEEKPRGRSTQGGRREQVARLKPSRESAPNDPLMQRLREWRLAKAKDKKLPAFRIASDRVLLQISDDRPLSEDDLLAIPGIGPAFTKRHGPEILQIVRAFEAAE